MQVKAPASEVRAKHEAALAAANTDLEEIRMKEEQEVSAYTTVRTPAAAPYHGCSVWLCSHRQTV